MAVTGSRSSSDGRRAAARRTPRTAGNGRGRARGTVPAVAERLARLTAVRPGAHRVGQLLPQARAAGPEPRQVPHQGQEPGARGDAGAAAARPRPRAVQEAIVRDLDRVQQYLRAPANLPSTQGIAIFACEAIGLFEALPLPVVLPLPPGGRRDAARPRAGLGRGRVRPAAHGGARPHGRPVLRGDGLRHAASCPGLRADSTRGERFHGDQSGPGWGEHTYHNRIRDEKQRHYEAIARELFTIDRRQPGARDRARGHRDRRRARSSRSCTTTWSSGSSAPPGSTRRRRRPPPVHAATLAVREAWERDEERALVREMLEGARQRVER